MAVTELASEEPNTEDGGTRASGVRSSMVVSASSWSMGMLLTLMTGFLNENVVVSRRMVDCMAPIDRVWLYLPSFTRLSLSFSFSLSSMPARSMAIRKRKKRGILSSWG